jgi:hypothetical protein
MKSRSSRSRQRKVVTLSTVGLMVTPPGTIEALCGIFPEKTAESSWALSRMLRAWM